MVRTRAQLAAGPEGEAPGPSTQATSSSAAAAAPRRAFGDVDNRRKGKRKAAVVKKEAEPAPVAKKPRETKYAVDKSDSDDPQSCTEYVVDLYNYYREAEGRRPMELYMEFQQDINPKMRAILVDWLVEVHLKFKMLQPTIYLTIQIIDRYLSAKQIDRNKLQLLGVAALFIASKYEEIYPPEVADCTYITDHAYDAQDVLDMEMTILRELDWNITAPNAHVWLVRLCRVARVPKAAADRAEYFAQRMLQEYAMLEYKPSMIAAAAAHLAFVADEACGEDWPRACERLTGYTDVELYPCCKAISYHINRAAKDDAKRQLVACKKKFSRHDFSTVSFGKCPVLKRPKLIDLPDLAD